MKYFLFILVGLLFFGAYVVPTAEYAVKLHTQTAVGSVSTSAPVPTPRYQPVTEMHVSCTTFDLLSDTDKATCIALGEREPLSGCVTCRDEPLPTADPVRAGQIQSGLQKILLSF